MKYLVALLALAGCSKPRQSLLPLDVYAIHQFQSSASREPMNRLVVTPVPGHPELRAALYDWQAEWWGSFGVYHLSDGGVDWRATCADEPTEQSIYRLRALELPGFRGPVIEVLGMTHMGNGSLYLYELRGRSLELLLQTKAVARNWGGPMVRNTALDISYPSQGIAPPDVLLSGELQECEGDGEIIVNAWYCRKMFAWSPARGGYLEKSEERIGIPDWWD